MVARQVSAGLLPVGDLFMFTVWNDGGDGRHRETDRGAKGIKLQLQGLWMQTLWLELQITKRVRPESFMQEGCARSADIINGMDEFDVCVVRVNWQRCSIKLCDVLQE